METPLIYTKNGNVPESTLEYSHSWQIGEELIMFREEWRDKETGELVKNCAHAYALKGLPPIGGEQAKI